MRNVMLNRIEQIRKMENGFSRDTMRWSRFYIEDQHVSKVDFESLSDEDLVKAFEMIIQKMYRQM